MRNVSALYERGRDVCVRNAPPFSGAYVRSTVRVGRLRVLPYTTLPAQEAQGGLEGDLEFLLKDFKFL